MDMTQPARHRAPMRTQQPMPTSAALLLALGALIVVVVIALQVM